MAYRIVFKDTPLAFIRALPKEDRQRIGQALRCLEANPFKPRPGCDTKKLQSLRHRETAYRLRIGPWRAGYVVRDEVVEIREFGLRDKRYDF